MKDYKIMKINKSALKMKKYWLYVVALLLPLFAFGQTLPAYTLIGENTVCGGNIKVDWSAAVTAGIPVSLWHVELYNRYCAVYQ